MFHPELLARFTTHLKDALQKGLLFSLKNGRSLLEPGDVLVGLLQEQGSIAADVLEKFHVERSEAEATFAKSKRGAKAGTTLTPDLSPLTKRLLEKCVLCAHLSEHKYVGTEHLLLALLEIDAPEVRAFLLGKGASLSDLKSQVEVILKATARFPDLTDPAHTIHSPEEDHATPMPTPVGPARENRRSERVSALNVFAVELSSAKTVATLDPVIGRDTETDRVIQILCRRSKNNPLLLGEPGVGKTAVVEGLAQRIAAGDVPDTLQGKRLFSLDLALMVAGTMYRGEFEARLKQLVEEVKTDPNILLFIDEMHTIVGAGSASGSMDAANILKPALARGEIRCIGATTWNEYKKHIEPDAALERRYQTVHILEPDAAKTLQMLQGLKARYEDHHAVTFTDAALQASVHLAARHLTDRQFPDKAIDLLDEAAARVNASRRSGEPIERLRSLDVALTALREKKETAVAKGLLEEVSTDMAQEERLQKEKKILHDQLAARRNAKRVLVGSEDIAFVVARMANIPLALVEASERDQLTELETRLSATIFGQARAVKSVSDTIRRARLGLADPRRPKASFLFIGPTGVGKTELARALAKEIFGREDALVKLDMSEFSEGHSIAKLLGSPAGYVGYRESNRLADTLRTHPHAVYLFDEFEKAHPDVQHILLQALEDGQIHDATGRAISFRHAYIVLTSNAGAEFANRVALGFGATVPSPEQQDTLIKNQLKDSFRLELLNRLDKVVVFHALEKEHLKEITRREVAEVIRRLKTAQSGIYTVGDDVLEWLLTAHTRHPDEGARAARRLVEEHIVSVMSQALLDTPKKHRWDLRIRKNALVLT